MWRTRLRRLAEPGKLVGFSACDAAVGFRSRLAIEALQTAQATHGRGNMLTLKDGEVRRDGEFLVVERLAEHLGLEKGLPATTSAARAQIRRGCTRRSR